jgi:murein DD-endopeptidase MepM/ murein hydrolase activator NlpD
MEQLQIILYFIQYLNGQVVFTSNNPNQALGCQIQILDNFGRYWRYCHLVENSIQVQTGQTVGLNTPLGNMGDTRKRNRKTLAFRVFFNAKLELFYIYKSM